MIITFLRSSSYNAYDQCQNRFFLDYILGWTSKANFAATKGNVCHKALEILTHSHVCIQNDQIEFKEEEIGEVLKCEDISTDYALQLAFDHYKKLEPQFNWDNGALQECKKYVITALTYKNGQYSPLNKEIVAIEKFFNIEIDKDWAKYEYDFEGQKLTGRLSLKGHIDLITKSDANTIEILDYKTGKLWNWDKNREKTYDDLYNDPQMRLYYYVIKKLYPEYNIGLVIFYLKVKKPFHLEFDDSVMEETEEMLRKRFEEIQNNKKPSLIYPNWWCSRLCSYGQETYENTGKLQCLHIRDEVTKLGIDRVISKYAKDKTFANYGSGGGNSSV